MTLDWGETGLFGLPAGTWLRTAAVQVGARHSHQRATGRCLPNCGVLRQRKSFDDAEMKNLQIRYETMEMQATAWSVA